MIVRNFCSKWNELVIQFILLAIIVGTFGNALLNGFVWDDKFFIVNNPIYHNFDVTGMLLSLGNGVEYLPFRDLTIAIDWQLAGGIPAVFHASNIIYYALNISAVYFFSRRLCHSFAVFDDEEPARELLPLLTAILFAIHPIHSEAVSFITCRNVLLSGLFFFLSCNFFLRWQNKRGSYLYLASVVTFVSALLSKATVVVLPFLLLFLFWRAAETKRHTLRILAPFIAASLIITVLFVRLADTSHVFIHNLSQTEASSLFDKFAIALQIPFFYLYKLLLPLSLTIEYDVPFASSFLSFKALSALFGWAALIALGVRLRKRQPLISFMILWYFVTLLPVLNLLPSHPIVADRYAYLPSYAFCFMVAYGLIQLRLHINKRLVTGITLLLMLGWSGKAFKQNQVWRNEQTLFENAVRYAPGVNMVVTSLGRVYFHSGQYQRALDLFRRAQEQDPHDPHYDYFRGLLAYSLEGNTGKANYYFRQSIMRKDDFIEGLYYAGLLSEKTGDIGLARQLYQRAIDSREYDVSNLRGLAVQNLHKLSGIN